MSPTTFRAMGTVVEVHGASTTGLAEVRRLFASMERTFSRFEPDSELSRLNRSGTRGFAVSEHMASILAVARDLADRTSGLVDPGVGAAVSAWGYDRSFEHLEPPSARPRVGAGARWALSDGMVYLDDGVRLDLGGIAKGWTCDLAVERGLAQVVSAGGDLRSTDPDLVVEIIDGTEQVVGEVALGVGALATSSRVKRRWSVDGTEAHHLIDPRSMEPARTPVLSATVVARTAVEAEAGAKAVLLRGRDGLAWADGQPWIDRAIVIWHDESIYATGERRAS